MSGWSQRESMALAVDLGRQGATVVDRKNGWTVRFPDGKTTMSIHKTPSDHRTSANYRAEVLRAGFKWPFDGEGFRRGGRDAVIDDVRSEVKAAEDRGAVAFDGDTMRPMTVAHTSVLNDDGSVAYVDENPREGDIPWYPAHVTVDPRPAAKNIGAVRGAIVAMKLAVVEDDLGLTKFLRQSGQMLTIESVRRVLYWLGYRYDPATVRRVTRGFNGTWTMVPELDRTRFEAEDGALPLTELAPPKERKPRREKPESTGGEPVENEVDVAGILALRGGPVDLEEALTVSGVEVVHEHTDEGEQDVVDVSALEVAEELLRDAEALSERRRAAMERMHRERDAARAEVERLQGLLARERSGPAPADDGSWSVHATDFVVEPHHDACLPLAAFGAAKLDVFVTFRPRS